MSQTATMRANLFRILLTIFGVVLVGAGQFVLRDVDSGNANEGMFQAISVALGVIGSLLFGLALSRTKLPDPLPRLEFPRSNQISAPALPWRSLWALIWFVIALVLAGVAIYMFATTGEDRIVVLLWLGSILALFVGQWWDVRIMFPTIAPERRVTLAVLAVVLIVYLITRTYHLTTLPYNLDGDFADVGLQARALVTGQQQSIFANGWAAIPMLGYLPPWITMKLFGTGLVGLNASGVIEGLLIIFGVYLLGRDLFNARVGLFAAILLTISYTHLAASRQSSYIDPVVFLVYAIYFLLIGLREGRGWAVIASGVLTALCIQMYYSGRLVVFVVAFLLLYLLIFRRAWLLGRAWAVVLWGVAVLVALGPMVLVILNDFASFMSRTREVFLLSPEVSRHMQGVYGVDSVPAMLFEQARHTVLILNYYFDKSTQYALGLPFLDPFTAVLFMLGVGLALFRWRSVGYSTILGWALLGLLVGCFLTANAPFWPRLLVLLPPAALLAALSLNQIYDLFKRGLERIHLRAAWIALVIAACVLAFVGVANWNAYVAAKGTYATPRTAIGRYLADQSPSARAYLVSADFTYKDRELEFLAPGRLVANLAPEQVEEAIAPVGSPTLLILTREQQDLLPLLQQRFPGQSVETVIGNSATEVAFYVFRLPQ